MRLPPTPNETNDMNDYKRPKLHLPLALLASKTASRPTPLPAYQAPDALRRLVAAMVD